MADDTPTTREIIRAHGHPAPEPAAVARARTAYERGQAAAPDAASARAARAIELAEQMRTRAA